MKKNLFRAFSLIMVLAISLSLFAGCDSKDGGKTDEGETTAQAAPECKYTKALFTIKNMGSFVVEVYPEYAPVTAANFMSLVESGYYDGLTFHRVVDSFMAQGGDGASAGKSTPSINGEFSQNGFTQNTLKHERGVISMARTADPNSASSQFFICYADATHLDGGYAAFGKVISGMEVVDSFCNVERTANAMGEIAVPVNDIIIETAVPITD